MLRKKIKRTEICMVKNYLSVNLDIVTNFYNAFDEVKISHIVLVGLNNLISTKLSLIKHPVGALSLYIKNFKLKHFRLGSRRAVGLSVAVLRF